MGPSRAHGPSAGPAEANGLPEDHGPGVIVPPCPPLGGPESGNGALASTGVARIFDWEGAQTTYNDIQWRR